MNNADRELYLRVMNGDRGLLPVLYLISRDPFRGFILSDLARKGTVGQSLKEMIARDFRGDIYAAVDALGNRARLQVSG